MRFLRQQLVVQWCFITDFFDLCNTALSSLIFKYKFEVVTITISSVSYQNMG